MMSQREARYDSERQPGRAAMRSRPGRESLRKRLGKTAIAIAERDGHRCQYCGATAAKSGAHLQLDHLTPRSQGGADEATNLVTACRPCNRQKSTMSLSAWCRLIGASARAIRAQARRQLPDCGQRRRAA